jgi:hypothetical protein
MWRRHWERLKSASSRKRQKGKIVMKIQTYQINEGTGEIIGMACGCIACNEEVQPGHFACELPSEHGRIQEAAGDIYRSYQDGAWRWFIVSDAWHAYPAGRVPLADYYDAKLKAVAPEAAAELCYWKWPPSGGECDPPADVPGYEVFDNGSDYWWVRRV